ncbi:glycosyltransferase family protein [Nisaea acidiphila]|uniref:Glycosyltransferase family protein n=1 Tax=Nisaea acidiphila TaxID=1862145 RepID=A0A9J7AVU7_9PROT|nr:glycosyltransferase family protein [Nisaea acidiphila]UUX51432.1 glycosyltransferase family protein [Nisaea acidiphila]
MKTVAIIQARMTSTRLPGKVLREVLGTPLLGYQIERVRRCRTVDEIVLATTTNATDDPVADFAARNGLRLWRGSEDDVLSRYAGAAEMAGADIVVRLTADCPLLDPELVDIVVSTLLESDPPLDYVSNAGTGTLPDGLDAEVMRAAALMAAYLEATECQEREHVTPFIYNHPERFACRRLRQDPPIEGQRWTVDQPEDFELVRRIIEALYPRNPEFGYRDVLALLDAHPDWVEINRVVAAKPKPVKNEDGAYPEQA